jgi:hypothetical protein
VERIVTTPEADGLGEMIAGIIRGNIASRPARAKLLDGVIGRVNIRANDADVEIGMLFTGHQLSIGSPFPEPDIAVVADAETLLALSTVPLRFGRPDPMTPEGRVIIGKMARGDLVVRGQLVHPKLLTRLQKLLSVT